MLSSYSDSDSELVQPEEEPDEDPESSMSDATSEEQVDEERLLRALGMGDVVVEGAVDDAFDSGRIWANERRLASPRTLDTNADEDD